ncbi:protein NEGATIVE REGULATOR OF RESISTANCE-like [Phoenix dactylifera]|uniref:Protein NEGATIVE REGULATOR OF RESISTANCE-like n=1 Tax=Phoenix dactylifera TaxID=42345 RepID=A0A8B8J9W0_PHODC|nr:protein NEGATIVE REGULATOR OF RESISTANCE-like [Phoenix dactylifera]
METGRNDKRPWSGSDDEERLKRPKVDKGDDRTVTEEEVEEFYAALRRIREVSKGVVSRNGSRGVRGGGRGGAASWVPAFKWEDFEEGGVVEVNVTETPTNEAETSGGESRRRTKVADEERVAKDDGRCLDLNAQPETKGVGRSKPEPGGDSTASFPPSSS